MTWNPSQYSLFSSQRLRPALDLIARIGLTNPHRIYDLGCGTGTVTALLADRWPQARITGLDASETMLARARSGAARADWQQANLGDWIPADRPDLIFSNAALHWVEGNERLLPRWLGYLAPGGVLAVQMPNNFDAPSHTQIAAVAQAAQWRERLQPMLRADPVAPPATYLELLGTSAAEVEVWETIYFQVLDGEDPVKEWTKGTWLKQFLDALTPAEAREFETDYALRLRSDYPPRPDGRTVFPFRRLFLVARAGGR